jgi:hypothetical protein
MHTHLETGRKALYVNGGHTLRFVGMTGAESAPLLEYLFAHQVRPPNSPVASTGSPARRSGLSWGAIRGKHHPLKT